MRRIRHDFLGKHSLLLICSLLTFVAMGQSGYRFAHLGTKEGLLSDQAYCLLEDEHGYIWIGTSGGLQRYDGDELVDYPLVNNGSESVFVRDVVSQGPDTVWIAIRGGGIRSIIKGVMQPAITTQQGLSSNLAECLLLDSKGTLWVGTIDEGINQLIGGRVQKNLEFRGDSIGLASKEIYALMEDQLGNIWVGTTKGINIYDGRTSSTYFLNEPGNPASLSHDYVHEIHQDNAGDIWVGTVDGGLNLFSPSDSTFTSFKHEPAVPASISHDVVLAIQGDPKGGLWIGSWGGGLNYFDGKNFLSHQVGPSSALGLKSNQVEDVMIDSKGDLWIATYQGGVSKYYDQTFTTYNIQDRGVEGMIQSTITHLSQSADGGLWISTNNGVNKFRNGKFESYTVQSGHLKFNDVHKILEDSKGGLWMGLVGTGRGVQLLKDGELTHFYHSDKDSLSLSSDFVESIYEDASGNIWIGTRDGLNLYQNGQFKRFKVKSGDGTHLLSNQVRGICDSKSGGIWIATYGGGLSHLKDEEVTNFYDEQSMPFKNLWGVVQDQMGDLWIALSGKIVKFNPITKQLKVYGEEDGLDNRWIEELLIDPNHRLWAATSKGLTLYLPGVDKFRTFTREDGLAGNDIYSISQNTHSIYIGGEGGFASIDLEDTDIDDVESKLSFTRLELLDFKSIDDSPRPEWRMIEDEIRLSHDENNFNIYFSAMALDIGGNQQYSYKIQNLADHWIFNRNSNKVSFIDVPPGNYKLQVKQLERPKVIELTITIAPPLWRMTWAYVIYCAILLLVGIATLSFIRKRKRLRRELERSEYFRTKDNELNQVKLNFFTNVSHELRTPLTLILGPVQDLIEDKVSPAHKRKLTFVRDNSLKLLQLTNQLLDFRKVSADKMQLLAMRQDILPVIESSFQAFSHKAKRHNIQYKLKGELNAIEMFFDLAKLETVLMNLISNAFKFHDGKISIEIQIAGNPECEAQFKDDELIDNYLAITVVDNGTGIQKDKIPYIFDRFYQAKQSDSINSVGTGIGLALSKDLIDLHHGKLSVESHSSVKTVFMIKLPFGHQHLKSNEIVIEHTEEETGMLDVSSQPSEDEVNLDSEEVSSAYSILLVEDNDDLRSYLMTALSKRYEIRTARDGREALLLLENHEPDLIISDVMMEGVDGISLCRQVKSNEERSHIPVILLTARSLAEHELEGLQAGANDYIIKPFNLKTLMVKVDNLFLMRQRFISFYQSILQNSDGPKEETPDQAFISEIITAIEGNLQEHKFGVAELARMFGMSKSALYKKVRFLLDKSVVELITDVRLKQAAQLISTSDKRISEIGYEIGFNDPKYFRNCFKKQYGKTPVDYRKESQRQVLET